MKIEAMLPLNIRRWREREIHKRSLNEASVLLTCTSFRCSCSFEDLLPGCKNLLRAAGALGV